MSSLSSFSPPSITTSSPNHACHITRTNAPKPVPLPPYPKHPMQKNKHPRPYLTPPSPLHSNQSHHSEPKTNQVQTQASAAAATGPNQSTTPTQATADTHVPCASTTASTEQTVSAAMRRWHARAPPCAPTSSAAISPSTTACTPWDMSTAALCRGCALPLAWDGNLLVRTMCFLWGLRVGVGVGVIGRGVGVGVEGSRPVRVGTGVGGVGGRWFRGGFN